jgi:ubiquinone/menaquinone biosynthesis C-methylase UbiE
VAREPVREAIGVLGLRGWQSDDRVLEVGFGPGVAVEEASRAATRGLVVGVDHSEVMLAQASRRNAHAVREGRVQLRLSTVEELPVFDAPFHKIFSINSIGFWTDPVRRLASLRELLLPGGTLVLTVQPRGRDANEGAVERTSERLSDSMTRAGLMGVRQEIRRMKPVATVAVIGAR